MGDGWSWAAYLYNEEDEMDHREADDNMLRKIEERGYPGFPSTSQADEMLKKAGDPQMYSLPDEAYRSLYPPHKFQPTQTGLLGAPCAVCGGLPTDPGHIQEGEAVTNIDEHKVLEQIKKPAVWVERLAADMVSYEIQNISNEQALRVVLDVLPKALELYLNKSRDYGGNVMDRFGLGPKACIPDMARKFGKLIDSIWNEQPLQYEQPDEILMDLFGHIVIILDERRNRNNDDLRRMGQ